MPVSLPRSVVAPEVTSACTISARIIYSIVALGSIWCSSLDVASAQAPAPAPAAERPPKEMTAGVKADGTTKVDLAPLIARGTKRAQLWSAVFPMFGPEASAPSQTQLDNLDTFAVWVLAELTWPASPSDSRTTPEYKRMYTKYRELLKAAGNEDSKAPLHDRVNAVLMANLPMMINDKEYSMTARYNAMLLLGQLDQIEADPLKPGGPRPGVPLAAAEDLLLKASQSSGLPEVLRVGAFVGLARHADMAMPATFRPQIAAEALKMLSATQPPQGISETGLQWLRKLSMQIVVGMLQRGVSDVKTPDYVKALVAILGNDKQPLFLRRDAALTLGYYDPTTIVQGAKPEDVVKAMTNLTLTVMKAGTPRENPDAPADLTKGEDVLPTPTKDTQKNFAQAVSYYLNCIAMGLGGRPDSKGKGLMKSAGASAPQVAKLLKPIDDIVNLMSKSNTGPEEMMSKIASAHDELKSWAESNNLLAVPAAATPTATAAPQPTQGASPAPPPATRQPGTGSIFPSSAGPVFGATPRGN